jgi:AraC-like DNA-binding protein/uncharacterized protein HemY
MYLSIPGLKNLDVAKHNTAIFLLLLFAAISSASGQNKITDSLSVALENHVMDDTLEVNLLNELSLRTLKNHPEQSLRHAERALNLAEQLKFNKGISEAENNLAIYNLMRGDEEASLSLALHALRVAEREHQLQLMANIYATLGTIYHKQLDYTKSLHYLRMAQQHNRKTNNVLTASKILNALGSIARDKKNYDSALSYYTKALAVMAKAREDYRVPEVINNIGLIYTQQNNDALALSYYTRALQVARKNENRRTEALVLGNIGNTLLSQKQYVEAENFLTKAIALSKEIGDRHNLSANYMEMMQLKNETGKFTEAHQYMAAYYQLKDSVLNVEKVKQIARLEIQYETQKKEHAIALLQRDKEIQLLWKNILIAALIVMALASTVLYYGQRFRERKNRQILNLEIDRLTSEHNKLSEKYRSAFMVKDEKSIDSLDQRLLKKAIEVIESNMSDPLFTVEKMGKEMGMSRTNLHRKIKEITGFAPSELIRNIRLRKAASLLLSEWNSVSQISSVVGFEDHSYFSKSFKKQFGVPPSEYLQSKEKK